MIEEFSTILIGGAAAFFICALVYGVKGVRRWWTRLLWPYFIADYVRFMRHPIGSPRWRKIAFWIAIQLACLSGLITVAYFAREIFGSHQWRGLRFTIGLLSVDLMHCEHGSHNAALWAIRSLTVIVIMNLLTAVIIAWEDVSIELLNSFARNKFIERGRAKIKLLSPFTYLLKSDAPFTIERVNKERDAIQRAAGVIILGVGNAPPSGIVIMASRSGLPGKSLQLSDLTGAESSANKFVVGMNPSPVYHDFRQRPQVGIFGPTGQGKSTLGRSVCAMANIANPHTVNIFVDIEGVDYAAASREFSNRERAGRTYASWQNESKRLRNVIHVTDIATLERVMMLVADEYGKRSHSCRVNGVENVAMLADASRWQTKLFDADLVKLQMRTSRILIFFDDFSSVYDEFAGEKSFKKSMKIYRKLVSRGRKYMISTISLTGRPDFETFAGARDEIGWYGVGAFARRAGVMVYEQEVSGTHRRGTFVYQLESPYEGTAVALGADVPLSSSAQSLVAALTQSHQKASSGTLALGDWFNTKLHQVQHDEELEKVHEGVEKFLLESF